MSNTKPPLPKSRPGGPTKARERRAGSLLTFATILVGCSSSDGSVTTTPGLNSGNGVSGASSVGGASSTGGVSGLPLGGAPPVGGSGGFVPPAAGGAGAGPLGNTGGVGTPVNPGGSGGVPLAAGGSPNGGGGATGGSGGGTDPSAGCAGETLPAVTDYSANGPFPTTTVNNTGPDGNYTLVRPTTLGANGFKHPVATWGNGITTTPSYYPGLLGAIASHGFVIVASNSSNVTTQLMTAGLDWMVAQNTAAGDYQGKLNATCLVTIGYSLGGGASVGAGAHANVVATASMHGVTGASNTLHAPLLLLTSETDTFVVPATFVTPTFDMSTVQTFYGTLSSAADSGNSGHLIPVDILPSSANLLERAAMVAWLRLWVYSDQGAKKYFYGDDCTLCKAPWAAPQRKNWK